MGLMRNDPLANRQEYLADNAFVQRIAAVQQRNGFANQARAALEKAAAAHPDDWRTLLRLAELHRRQGDLAAALPLYRRVAAQAGDAKAAWLSAVLGGAALPKAPTGKEGEGAEGEGTWPAPFVRIKNFLPPHQCDGLLALVMAKQRHFKAVMIGNKEVDPDVRRGLHVAGQVKRQVRPWFLPKLCAALSEVLPRVPVGPLVDPFVELHVTASPAGSEFKIHRDRTEASSLRRLTWAYYFHRRPRRFSGGDLLLHDSLPDGRGYSAVAFTCLAPLHNSIVFFPSSCFHQVTPVEGEPGDFANCRFTLNGHFNLRPSAAANG